MRNGVLACWMAGPNVIANVVHLQHALRQAEAISP